MTFGRVAEALPQAIGCVSWQKLVKSFFLDADIIDVPNQPEGTCRRPAGML